MMTQQLTIIDKVDLLILEKERHLKAAKLELQNENLTEGQCRAIHVEIEKLTFCLNTLKFIKDE